MTSNISSNLIMKMGRTGEFGFSDENNSTSESSSSANHKRIKSKIRESLFSHFKPEFLNRVDEIITFHPLEEEQIRQILDLQLEKIKSRLDKKRISIKVNNKAKLLLAKQGYDPSLGARPLRRIIEQQVVNPIALLLLENKVKDGEIIKVGVKDGVLAIG